MAEPVCQPHQPLFQPWDFRWICRQDTCDLGIEGERPWEWSPDAQCLICCLTIYYYNNYIRKRIFVDFFSRLRVLKGKNVSRTTCITINIFMYCRDDFSYLFMGKLWGNFYFLSFRMVPDPLSSEEWFSVRNLIFVVWCNNVKNGKEASEVTEGKSSRICWERWTEWRKIGEEKRTA